MEWKKLLKRLYFRKFNILPLYHALKHWTEFIRTLDAQNSHICTFNSWLLNLMAMCLKCLSKKDVLSWFHVASDTYLHSLSGVYGIKEHSLLYRIWFLLASTYIYHSSYDVCGVESWHIWNHIGFLLSSCMCISTCLDNIICTSMS